MESTNGKELMVGKSITLYLEGGWTLTGIVQHNEKNKIIIKSEDELYLTFKEKVCAIKLNKPEDSKRTYPEPTKAYVGRDSKSFPENSLQYDEGGMSIPRSLLNSDVEGDDFAISFGKEPLPEGESESGISFKLDEDT